MTDQEAMQKLKKLLSTVDYTEFVKNLAVSANDQKIRNLLDEKLNNGKPFYIRRVDINVTKLHPLQNEIDTNKSLEWPITKLDSCRQYFTSGPVTFKFPLFTFDSEWIVDGHHRWSQVYCMNPKANMTCFDLLAHLQPLDVLKIIQIKIAADTGKLKTAPVNGSNLLDVPLDSLATYIDKNMANDVDSFLRLQYKVSTRDEVIKQILANVNEMRLKSQPIKGAPNRGVMLQTDAIPNMADNIRNGEVSQDTMKQFSQIINKFTRMEEFMTFKSNKNFSAKSDKLFSKFSEDFDLNDPYVIIYSNDSNNPRDFKGGDITPKRSVAEDWLKETLSDSKYAKLIRLSEVKKYAPCSAYAGNEKEYLDNLMDAYKKFGPSCFDNFSENNTYVIMAKASKWRTGGRSYWAILSNFDGNTFVNSSTPIRPDSNFEIENIGFFFNPHFTRYRTDVVVINDIKKATEIAKFIRNKIAPRNNAGAPAQWVNVTVREVLSDLPTFCRIWSRD